MLIYGLNSNAPVGGANSSSSTRTGYKSVRKARKSSTRAKTTKSVRGRKKSVKKRKSSKKKGNRVVKGGKVKKLNKKNINLLKRLGIRVKKRR